MFRYFVVFVLLLQVGCASVNKNFSDNKETLKSYCDQVMETSNITNTDREYKSEYSQCLLNGMNSVTKSKDVQTRLAGGTVLMAVYLLVAKFLFFDVK
ncbi:MAG: hypothetical protein OXK80_03615 [Bdellovibrionales bacterium]|nr:hypothetical protein [Bdellovibrionales bacterium]